MKFRIYYDVESTDGTDEVYSEVYEVEAESESQAREFMLNYETGFVHLSSIEVEQIVEDEEITESTDIPTEKYFAFTGDNLEYLGEFEDIDEAFMYADENGFENSFYIGDQKHFKELLKKFEKALDI